jgi:uncharacterized protein DUF4911
VSDVIAIHLRLPPHEIAYVKFIFESYEGIGLVRTLDRRAAHLVVLAVPDFEAQVRAVIAALVAEGACTPSEAPADWQGDVLGPDAGS